MSELTNNKKFTPLLFLVPVLWISSGMLWDGDGDMRLVPIVLAVAAISIFLFRFDIIKDNFKNSFWIKLLLINGFFGAIAYEVYGFDSRELRATLSVLVLLLITPSYLYKKQTIQWFVFVSSLCCLIYAYYYQFISVLGRASWPINAIPFATICGLVSIVSLGLLFFRFKEKKVTLLTISIAFSSLGLLLSQSRGPFVATIIVVFVLFLYVSFRKSKSLGLCAFIFLTTAVWGASKLPVVQERVESTIREYNQIDSGNYYSSIGIRIQMFKVGIDLWQKKPLLGFGKEIQHEFDRLESENLIPRNVSRYISMSFHNGYLDKFVLYGLLGGGIFLTFLIYPILLSRLYSIENGSTLLWPPALFIAICNLSDAPFINAQAAIYYMFIIGSVTMMLSNEKERE